MASSDDPLGGLLDSVGSSISIGQLNDALPSELDINNGKSQLNSNNQLDVTEGNGTVTQNSSAELTGSSANTQNAGSVSLLKPQQQGTASVSSSNFNAVKPKLEKYDSYMSPAASGVATGATSQLPTTIPLANEQNSGAASIGGSDNLPVSRNLPAPASLQHTSGSVSVNNVQNSVINSASGMAHNGGLGASAMISLAKIAAEQQPLQANVNTNSVNPVTTITSQPFMLKQEPITTNNPVNMQANTQFVMHPDNSVANIGGKQTLVVQQGTAPMTVVRAPAQMSALAAARTSSPQQVQPIRHILQPAQAPHSNPAAVRIMQPQQVAPQPAIQAPRMQPGGHTITLPPGVQLPPGAVLMRNSQGHFVIMNVPGQTVPQNRPNAPVMIRPGLPGQPQAGPGQQIIQTSSGPQIFLRQGKPPTNNIVQTPSVRLMPPGPSPQRLQVAAPALPEDVQKCNNFLSTLIRLSTRQAPDTIANVKNLIQGLIDGNVQPEAFTSKLQQELNSSPQPGLIPFLKNSLPMLREALKKNELQIDGIRAPGMSVGATALRPAQPQSQAGPMLQPYQPSMIRVQQVPGQPIQGVAIPKQGPGQQGRPNAPRMLHPGAQPPRAAPAPKPKQQRLDLKDDDDINDVATMGGVNLTEESKNILVAGTEAIGSQMRSCKDENFLYINALAARAKRIAHRKGLRDVNPEALSLISHATQQKLRHIMEKLSLASEHRLEIYKVDKKFVEESNVRGQLKFLEELDHLEKKRHGDQEREMLLRAAKSRSKNEDPEQAKLKQKAKEMQMAEMEEIQQRKANETALAAIGSRKKRKLEDTDTPGASGGGHHSLSSGTGQSSSSISGGTAVSKRPRLKKVSLRDLIFVMEKDPFYRKSSTLMKAYHK